MQSGLDRLDAQLLMLHALGRTQTDRAWLVTHDDEQLDAASRPRLHTTFANAALQANRLAYIVGSKPFFGLDLQVDQRVLVPRPDTETLGGVGTYLFEYQPTVLWTWALAAARLLWR